MIGLPDRLTEAVSPAGRLRRRLEIVLAGLLLALLVWVIGFSSVLGVRTVSVSGARFLSAQQVRDAAAIRSGTPLVRLQAEAIEARVRALPGVRSVTVGASYPSTATIKIIERVAVGYRQDGGATALVDGEDVAFRTVANAPAGLPRLDGSVDPARSAAMSAVAAALPAELAMKVASISAPTTESITLQLEDSRTVVWGGTDRSGEKARLLQALLGQPGSYFDLSDPDSVISRGAPPN